MSNLSVNTITDASGGSTASINGYTPQASNMAGTNLIINGAMTVAQRGTSVVGKTGALYQTCDRWLSNASGSTYNQSQEIVPLGDSIVGQFKYFLRHEVTTGANNAGLIYRIEDIQSLSGGALTLSFYAKGINPNNGTVQIETLQRFGTGGTPSSDVINFDSNITLTSNWQKFTLQIDYPSLSGKVLGTNNDSYYQLAFRQPNTDTSTDAWTLDLTGVQLEVGSSGSSFAHEDYGTTLQKCQRFYQDAYFRFRSDNSSAYPITGTYRSVNFGTTMRDAPTMDTSDVSTGSSVTLDNVTGYKQGFHFRGTASSGYNYWVYGSFHAEAEL